MRRDLNDTLSAERGKGNIEFEQTTCGRLTYYLFDPPSLDRLDTHTSWLDIDYKIVSLA